MAPEYVKKLWVVQYSCIQQTFHLETVERMLISNFNVTNKNVVPGFIPLFITEKYEEADIFIRHFRPVVDDRPLPINPAFPDGILPPVAAGMSDLTFDELMIRINKKG